MNGESNARHKDGWMDEGKKGRGGRKGMGGREGRGGRNGERERGREEGREGREGRRKAMHDTMMDGWFRGERGEGGMEKSNVRHKQHAI